MIAIDVETTGLSHQEDRIVELAVVRMSPSGVIEDEWSSLLNPGGDVGPTFIHHITNNMVEDAPSFRDLIGDILPRLEGGIVVSHHASFEEGFLASELAYLGIRLPMLPALCTLELTADLHDPPNMRLETCCTAAGVMKTDTGGALGDARLKAALASLLVSTPSLELRWPTVPSALPRYQTLARPRTRVTELRKGEQGWMAGVIAKLPITTGHQDPAEAEAYLEALGHVLADGKITGDEAKALARQAGRAGLGAAEIESLHRRFLAGLAAAALDDGVLTVEELKQLRNVASLLGLPGMFDHLSADTPGKPKSQKPAQRPRVWCSPSVEQVHREQIEALGTVLASNLTQKVSAMVVRDDGDLDQRVQKGIAWGINLVRLADLVEFRDGRPGESSFPAPTGPSQPPPWTTLRR